MKRFAVLRHDGCERCASSERECNSLYGPGNLTLHDSFATHTHSHGVHHITYLARNLDVCDLFI